MQIRREVLIGDPVQADASVLVTVDMTDDGARSIALIVSDFADSNGDYSKDAEPSVIILTREQASIIARILSDAASDG